MKIKPYSKKNNTNILQSNSSDKENNKEVGRSMVETLGVLAVIGVLSVGGIAGYQYAMNKYRSNELLNEASKRALIVVTQLAQGSNEISLEEFTENTYSGGTFSTTVTEWENQFAIEVSGVNQSVCKNLCIDVNGQENVSLAPVDNLETTLTADNCSDINALAFIFDKNLDDEIADDSDEEDNEDDTNKATYSCHNGTQIFKEDDFLANCTCEAGASGKYASDEEAITAICEDGQINPDEYSCSGGGIVMKNGQTFYNGCYCGVKSGSYYTEEEALANMCHSYNVYHCYTGKGVYKNNESYLISDCSCYTNYGTALLSDEEAISRLCLPTLDSYYCTNNGTQLNKNGTFLTYCHCSSSGSGYYTDEEAMSNLCLSLNSYYCTYYSGNSYLLKNGNPFTQCFCTNSNGSGYYYTDEEAVSIMCISGPSPIYYYCMSGHTLQRTGNDIISCYCISGQSNTYYSDSEAISNMCQSKWYYCSGGVTVQQSGHTISNCICSGSGTYYSDEAAIPNLCIGETTSFKYYCSDSTLYKNPQAIFVTNCPSVCYDPIKGGQGYNSDAEAIYNACREAAYYTCVSGARLLANDNENKLVTNCNCGSHISYYYKTHEEAISNMCK